MSNSNNAFGYDCLRWVSRFHVIYLSTN